MIGDQIMCVYVWVRVFVCVQLCEGVRVFGWYKTVKGEHVYVCKYVNVCVQT